MYGRHYGMASLFGQIIWTKKLTNMETQTEYERIYEMYCGKQSK